MEIVGWSLGLNDKNIAGPFRLAIAHVASNMTLSSLEFNYFLTLTQTPRTRFEQSEGGGGGGN